MTTRRTTTGEPVPARASVGTGHLPLLPGLPARPRAADLLEPDVRRMVVAALPAGLYDDLHAYVDDVFRSVWTSRGSPRSAELEGRRARLLSRVTTLRDRAAAAAQDCLAELDPASALTWRTFDRATRLPAAELLTHAGLNRFIWMVAVAGSGRRTDLRAVQAFCTAIAGWVAASHCMPYLAIRDADTPWELSSNAHHEEIGRQFSAEVRYAWVSQLILRSAAEVIREHPAEYGPMSRVTEHAVDGLFDLLRAFSGNSDEETLQRAQGLPEDVTALMSALSLPAGQLAGEAIASLALSTKLKERPFVDFGGTVFPVALRDAAFEVEQAFFEYARRALAVEKLRSDLFEQVVSRTVSKVTPPGMTALAPPLAIRQPGSEDPGEVDFAFLDPAGTLVLGEAKACFVTHASESVINAFANQVGKAVRQLDKRIARIRSGSSVTTATAPVTPADDRRVIGIAVPLHSYAQAVWNTAELGTVDGVRPDIAVVPLHQLVLTMQTMSSVSDLRRYLVLRATLIRIGVRVHDEVDMLVMHLVDPTGERLDGAVDDALRGVRPLLRGYRISGDTAMLTPRPRDRESWRRQLSADCR